MREHRSRAGILALALLSGVAGASSLRPVGPGPAVSQDAEYPALSSFADPVVSQGSDEASEPVPGAARPDQGERTAPGDGGGRAARDRPCSQYTVGRMPKADVDQSVPRQDGLGTGLLGLSASPANAPPWVQANA